MIAITTNPISIESVTAGLKQEYYGAVITFMGTVRNSDKNGKKVLGLEIEPNGSDAENRLRGIADEVKAKWNLSDVSIYRRVGKLKVGDTALVVALAAPHRREAFKACEYIMDRIKEGGITIEKDIY
jgi:molybdopterin synthase catalytic subunit